MAEKEIHAMMIIEVLGRPPEHLKIALETHIKKINNVKGCSLSSFNISDAKLVDKEKDMHSCFAEVEIKAENLSKVVELVFDFMPSSIEILEPSNIKFDAQQASMFLNDLSGKMHKYDNIAKIAQLRTKQVTQYAQMLKQKYEGKEEQKKISKSKKSKKKAAVKKKQNKKS